MSPVHQGALGPIKGLLSFCAAGACFNEPKLGNPFRPRQFLTRWISAVFPKKGLSTPKSVLTSYALLFMIDACGQQHLFGDWSVVRQGHAKLCGPDVVV